MNLLKSGLAIAASALGLAGLVPRGFHHMGRTRYAGGYRPARSRYMPHQGAREIARRLRQQARKDARS